MKDFLRCKKTLRIWQAKTKTKTLPRVQKRGWTILMSGKYPSQWAGLNSLPFLRGNSKKTWGRIWARKPGCYAVLFGQSFEELWQELHCFVRSWISQTRQRLEAKAKELRGSTGLRKGKKCLSCFKWSRQRIPVGLRSPPSVNILLKLS